MSRRWVPVRLRRGRWQPHWPMQVALFAAAMQALWHGWLIRNRTRDGCFKAFRLNHWLGFAVFAGIAGSYSLS